MIILFLLSNLNLIFYLGDDRNIRTLTVIIHFSLVKIFKLKFSSDPRLSLNHILQPREKTFYSKKYSGGKKRNLLMLSHASEYVMPNY